MTTSTAEATDGLSSAVLARRPGAVRVGERSLVRSSDGAAELNALVLPQVEAEAVLSGGLGFLPSHPHRELLVDVGVDRAGTVLLTRPPVVTTLDRVLASVRAIPPGVVVTILAPVFAALQESGVHGVHPAPEAEAVGLTADGRPVLLTSSCQPGGSAASARDAARVLLARCRQRCPDWPGTVDDEADLREMEAELYRSADPEPVGELLTAAPAELEPSDGPAGQGTPPRSRRIVARLASWRRRSPSPSPSTTTPPLGAGDAPPPGRHRRPHPLDDWRRRTAEFVMRRRGPLSVAVAVLLGSVVATSIGGGAPSGQGEARPTPSSAVPASTRGPIAPQPPAPDASPEEAAKLLVAAAQQCDDEGRCLHRLTTPDSPLRSDGAPRIADAVPEGAEVAGVVADVNGASALVSLHAGAETTAASVLMIRTEAGWLIRDVFGDGGR